jgi:hypothetical protein
MAALYRTLTSSESQTRDGRSSIPWLVLCTLCLFSRPAQAIQKSTYVFDPNQSTVVKTGGFAGVHEIYFVKGQFQLNVDFDTGTASFSRVDANLTDERGSEHGQSLGEIFNMTALPGIVVEDATVRFKGKTADGTNSDVLLTLTFRDDQVDLSGAITPPANTADLFCYELDAVASKKYSGGTGEPENPYLIDTAEQFNEIGLHDEDWDKHFKLMADIDLSSCSYHTSVIAVDTNSVTDQFEGTPFAGVFDGNGRTVSNFTCTSSGNDHVGLFGYVSGVIKDLGLRAPNIEAGTGDRVSALVGELGHGTITNCYIDDGSVKGRNYLGGLAGYNQGNITHSYSTAMIDGKVRIGGLVGLNDGDVSYCYSSCTVRGTDDIGGLVGYNTGYVTYCHSIGAVNGRGWASRVGGLVGMNFSAVTHSYSTDAVCGFRAVGGLVGTNGVGGRLSCCYSTGTICGDGVVGGLVGGNHGGCVLNCHSVSPTHGKESVGGLVGGNSSDVTHCYSAGIVGGTNDVGGLVGRGSPDYVNTSFWDIQTSGQTASAGGEGMATDEMQMARTFLEAGWDFMNEIENGTADIWWIQEGQDYPMLRELPASHRPAPRPAFCPEPEDGANDITQSPILSWTPGKPDLQYDVYVGEEKRAVTEATTESLGVYCGRQPPERTTYTAGSLQWGKTHYWRIDGIHEADPNRPWKGDIWSFTTANFLVVDDFESYTDNDAEGQAIWQVWTDGFGIPANGAAAGNLLPPWHTIVRSGRESLKFYYNNSGTAKYSEATANTAHLVIGQDWTKGGVETLSLWFYGGSDNALEPMYVALSNATGPTAEVYHDHPNALLIDEWAEWRINLGECAAQGVNLTNVDTISIGFGDKDNPQPGGTGVVFFDDIRLYRP